MRTEERSEGQEGALKSRTLAEKHHYLEMVARKVDAGRSSPFTRFARVNACHAYLTYIGDCIGTDKTTFPSSITA